MAGRMSAWHLKMPWLTKALCTAGNDGLGAGSEGRAAVAGQTWGSDSTIVLVRQPLQHGSERCKLKDCRSAPAM